MSVTPWKQRFWNNVSKTRGCWNWVGRLNHAGYGFMIRNRKRSTSPEIVSRLSYEIHYGKFDKSLNVCHKCDNTRCVNPKHLFLGSGRANLIDAKLKSRLRFGKNHPNRKLAVNQVIFIRTSKQTNKFLAEKYGVSPTIISDIKNFRKWKELPGECLFDARKNIMRKILICLDTLSDCDTTTFLVLQKQVALLAKALRVEIRTTKQCTCEVI